MKLEITSRSSEAAGSRLLTLQLPLLSRFSQSSLYGRQVVRALSCCFLIVIAITFTWGGDAGRRVLVSDQSYLRGVWSDACPCTVPCPCWRRHRANAKYCLNIQVFHIASGRYEGVDFANSTFVLVAQPEESYGTPFPYLLYSDRPVEEQQDRATGNLFQEIFGLAPQAGIEHAQVQTLITHRAHVTTIPGILKYDVAPPPDREEPPSGEIRGYLYSWLSNAKQWIVRDLEYQAADGSSSYRGTNSLSGSFQIAVASERDGALQGCQQHGPRPDSRLRAPDHYLCELRKSIELVTKGEVR